MTCVKTIVRMKEHAKRHKMSWHRQFNANAQIHVTLESNAKLICVKIHQLKTVVASAIVFYLLIKHLVIANATVQVIAIQFIVIIMENVKNQNVIVTKAFMVIDVSLK